MVVRDTHASAPAGPGASIRRSMRVLIFEPSPSGHRFTYVRRLVSAVSELAGDVIVVTSRKGAGSAQYVEQLHPIEAAFRLDVDDCEGSVSAAAMLARAMRRHEPEHVYLPYADRTIQVIGALRVAGLFHAPTGCELEGVMMRGALAYQAPGVRSSIRTAAWLALTSAAPFDVIHHLDRFAIAAIRARAPGLARRMQLLPDPVEVSPSVTPLEARGCLSIPTSGRLIGCVGSIDTRKGMDLLVKGFLLGKRDDDDRLLLAGEHDGALKAVIAGEARRAVNAGRIISIDRYLTDAEINLAIAALDVVAVPYPPGRGHSGSSSVLVHAAALGRPVLATDFGWVGRTTTELGLGTTCRVTDVPAFSRAIDLALKDASAYRPGERAKRFVAFSNETNFAEHITYRLRERLGLPVTRPTLTWDWVLADGVELAPGPVEE